MTIPFLDRRLRAPAALSSSPPTAWAEEDEEADALGEAERAGRAFRFRYLAASVLWVLGTDALIARLDAPRWVDSAKDLLYLLACGLALQRVVRHHLAGVRRSHEELASAKRELVERLARAAEYRDDETGGHNRRIARTARIVGEELGLGSVRLDRLFHAALLHDVGKIAVPDGVLRKAGPLDGAEREAMRRHTQVGADLLAGSPNPLLRTARDVARAHHERWDGGGYPLGLAGEAIPLEGRIVAVCDVFDALASERPYKRAWSTEDAAAENRKGSGSHFDPAVAEAFLRRLPEILAARDEPPRPWADLSVDRRAAA